MEGKTANIPAISKEEKEAIVKLGYYGWSDKAILSLHFPLERLVAFDALEHVEVIKKMHFDTLATALYKGYVVIQSPEEQLKDYYDKNRDSIGEVDFLIKKVLEILNKPVEGINA